MTMVLIKRGDKRDDGRPAAGMFDPLEECDMPSVWNGGHVARRIGDGMTTLRLLPMGGSRTASCAWPQYAYTFDDLVGQKKQGELEATQRLQNRTRVSPGVREIMRAVMTCYWPMHYLYVTHPHLCEAVNAVSLAHSFELPIEWVVRKRGGYVDTWRNRWVEGCEIIAEGLIVDREPVF